jgi:hypothetical protein
MFSDRRLRSLGLAIMEKSEYSLEQLDQIERRISALQDYLYDAELYPEQVERWARLRRAISLFLVRRYVLRQIQQLCLQRRVIRNCYLYVHEREPAASLVGSVEPVRSPRP